MYFHVLRLASDALIGLITSHDFRLENPMEGGRNMLATKAFGLAFIATLATPTAHAETAPETYAADAVLVDDFVTSLEAYASGMESLPAKPEVKLWLDGLKKRGVSGDVLRRRLSRAKAKAELEGIDPFARYRRLRIERLPEASPLEVEGLPTAMHAFRLDVVEDYDDVSNDDIYCYFITTHDDIVWGRVSSIYTGLDEGSSVFFSPVDRALFGPQGEKLAPKNHTLVDFGIIESDSGDIQELQKLSDAIIDLAIVALTVYDGGAGAAAAQARAEVQNLMRLIIGMDDDDRLVADTLRFTPQSMNEALAQSSVHELSRYYDQETFWTHFAYRIHFRLLR